jgi:hypothetical protein
MIAKLAMTMTNPFKSKLLLVNHLIATAMLLGLAVCVLIV